MPQIDTASFRSQVVQFVTTFVVLYRVMVGNILPALNRAVKVRVKKLEMTKGDSSRFDAERVKAEQAYGASLGGAAASSFALLSEAIAHQETQTKNSMNELSNVTMGEANTDYIDYIMEREARKGVLKDILDEEVDLA